MEDENYNKYYHGLVAELISKELKPYGEHVFVNVLDFDTCAYLRACPVLVSAVWPVCMCI